MLAIDRGRHYNDPSNFGGSVVGHAPDTAVFLSIKEFGMSQRLSGGSSLPATTINLAGGGQMTLPDDMGDGYKVIIFFRGYW